MYHLRKAQIFRGRAHGNERDVSSFSDSFWNRSKGKENPCKELENPKKTFDRMLHTYLEKPIINKVKMNEGKTIKI